MSDESFEPATLGCLKADVALLSASPARGLGAVRHKLAADLRRCDLSLDLPVLAFRNTLLF
jgi:hypothetical protein